jgi:hypothetical protein
MRSVSLAVAGLCLVASLPALAEPGQADAFHFGPQAPGAMWRLGIDDQGRFTADVVGPAAAYLGQQDTCLTLVPQAASCTGMLGTHTGQFHALYALGAFDALNGPTDVDVGIDYGAAGQFVWRCHFAANGGAVGIVLIPPGTSGFCQYLTPLPTSQAGPWTLFGRQVNGPGVVGPVLHTVM